MDDPVFQVNDPQLGELSDRIPDSLALVILLELSAESRQRDLQIVLTHEG